MIEVPEEGKYVVLLSGGLDSTTLLYYLRSLNYRVHALIVSYGQMHFKETLIASLLCKNLNQPYTLLRVSGLKTWTKVVEGEYTPENTKAMTVPFRNSIFLLHAANLAVSLGWRHVAYAAHKGDAPYPDCTAEYVYAMKTLLELAHHEPITLEAPFLGATKGEIVQLGAKLGVPLERTWSCYKGGDKHCGKCPTCLERKKAFEEAGIDDLTEYEHV